MRKDPKITGMKSALKRMMESKYHNAIKALERSVEALTVENKRLKKQGALDLADILSALNAKRGQPPRSCVITEPEKRGPGRPRKEPLDQIKKRGPGRPRKNEIFAARQ